MTEPETSSILHPSKLPIPKLKTSPKAQKASSIALSSILYKLIFFIVLIAILPQAPEFIGESIFTRVWELLHLLFVGIAVSYGIFSHRNADTGMVEKDSQQKDESPRSFVSQMLQVSPVFFDEEDDSGVADSKIQTWNSQFHRNEPETLVAKEAGIITEHLSLPVRSIKQSDQEITGRFDRSNYESKAQFSEPRTESVVLPSPIPWSSRSESNKVEQVVGSKSATTLPPHRPSSTSPSLSSDAAKPKSIYSKNNKASPPPAPPPPPPFLPKRKDTAETSKDEFNDTIAGLRPEGPSTGRSVRAYRSKQSHSTAMEGEAAREGGDEEEAASSGSGADENEVDKKADEFIARFREQIRLQRIESIKRSTKPRSNRNHN